MALLPDELPEGWAMSKVSEVFIDLRNGTTARQNDEGNGFPVSRIETVQDNKFDMNRIQYISDLSSENIEKFKYRKGDIAFSHINSYEHVGKTALYNGHPETFIHGMNLLRFRTIPSITDPAFLQLYMRSESFREAVRSRVNHAVNQVSINQRQISEIDIPVAPFAEQKRIVAKVEELFARINAAREHLNRIPSILKRFRQSVLAAACSGKLTADWRERNPDKNARELLIKIQEFHSLNRAQNRRSSAKEQMVDQEDPGLPTIPKSWIWVRFDTLLSELRNGISPRPNQDPPGLPVLRINSVRPLWVDIDEIRFLPNGDKFKSKYELRDGDLLFTRYNGSIELLGVCGQVRGLRNRTLLYPDKLMRVRFDHDFIMPSYIELFFSSPGARERMTAKAKSSAGQQGISGKDVKRQFVALPPIEEQKEIIQNVESLLNNCDGIDERVMNSFSLSERISSSILKLAFSGELIASEAEVARNESRNYESADVLLARIKAEREAAEPKKKTRRAGRKGKQKLVKEEVEQEAAPSKVFEQVETEKPSPKKKPSRKENIFDTDEVMRLFRTACRGTGEISEDDLLREVARQLDYQRLSKGIKQELKGHLKTAVRRNIIERNGSILRAATLRFNDYEDDFLRNTLKSVMRKGYEYDRNEVTKAIATYLGFSTVTQSISTRMKSIYNSGIRRGMIEGKGQIVWRIK